MTTMTSDFNPVHIDWQIALNNSPYTLYRTDSVNLALSDAYDFVLTIGDFTIFVLTAWQRCETLSDMAEVKRYHTKLANELIHRHARALNVLTDEYQKQVATANKYDGSRYDHNQLPKVYFVGLVGLSAIFSDGNEYFVDYDLGDSFFYEECVFDLDNPATVLQVFTVKDWQNLLAYVPSPTDLCAFFKYYCQSLVDQKSFPSALWLAEQFLLSAAFFERVRQVERQLEQLSLVVEHRHDNVEATRQQQLAPFWQKAVERVIEREQQANRPIDWNIIKKLLLQCGYTRLKIVDFVLSFVNTTDLQRQEGLVQHEHSYHKLGQHFVLVIYGLHPSSELSRINIAKQYTSILSHIDQNLEGQGVDDLFLLGFDLTQTDENGDTMVQMDIFYRQSQWQQVKR